MKSIELHCLLFLHFLLNCNTEVTEVSCIYLESCILPCFFKPGSDPVIHWTKQPEDVPVYIYYRNQYQPQHQNEKYRGRTSLSNDGISTGNASMLLQQVKVSDKGIYKCYVNTINTDITESSINLKVYAPVLEVIIQWNDKQVQCRSENIYPGPAVNWTFSPGPVPDPQTSIEESESGLFSVTSSVSLPESIALEYSCNISTEFSWKSETYRREGKHFPEWLILLIILSLICIFLSVILILLLINCIRQRKFFWSRWNVSRSKEVDSKGRREPEKLDCVEVPMTSVESLHTN